MRKYSRMRKRATHPSCSYYVGGSVADLLPYYTLRERERARAREALLQVLVILLLLVPLPLLVLLLQQ